MQGMEENRRSFCETIKERNYSYRFPPGKSRLMVPGRSNLRLKMTAGKSRMKKGEKRLTAQGDIF